MNSSRIKSTSHCLFLAILYCVFLAGCTSESRSRSGVSPLLSEIEGTWYWQQQEGQYYGHFVLTKQGDTYEGTMDDEREGTKGDRLIDVEITDNDIKFTRVGKHGIQYWQGKLKKKGGQLKIVKGRWEKKTGSIGVFEATKED